MDIVSVVDKLAEYGYVRPNKVSGDYYSIYCPFHNDGNERRPSCGVLLNEQHRGGHIYRAGWFHCFSCGASYDLVEAVEKLLSINSVSAIANEWLAEHIPGFQPMLDYDPLVPTATLDQLTNSFALNYIQEKTGDPRPFVSEEELAKYRYTVPYMYERKLTDEVIAAYDVGVDMEWKAPGRSKPTPCITFPVRDIQGRTLFFCRRSIQGKFYNYPENTIKPVYGIDMIRPGTQSVIIVESIINALTAVVYGYSAVALMGTGNSYQISQLKSLGAREYVICMDGDEAGRRAAKKLKSALQSVAIIWTVDMPDGKDLNDCSKEEFDTLYSERM